jgi:protein tyrosine phosphatase (PTP) superfamily phosphohydrolase (DUF442 family)
MKHARKRFIPLYAILLLSVCTNAAVGGVKIDREKSKLYQAQRPTNWAVEINEPGLPNFYKVSENLYRGAQPDANGFEKLKEMGIRTIINLRTFHSDNDKISDANIGYEQIRMQAWRTEYKDIVKFLKIVTDSNKTPVFVHCRHGADRTGLVCAVYRAAIEGWSKEDAIDEMIYGGYGFHYIWKNLPDYLMRLDIEKLKQQVSIRNGNQPNL